MLTDQNEETIASLHWQRFQFKGRRVFRKTEDKTWVNFFESGSKRPSMEWHHTNSPRKIGKETYGNSLLRCRGVIMVAYAQ